MVCIRILICLLALHTLCIGTTVFAATTWDNTTNNATNNATIMDFFRSIEQGNVSLPGTEITPEMLQKVFPAPLRQLAPFLNLGPTPTPAPHLLPSVPGQTLPLPQPRVALPAPAVSTPTVAVPNASTVLEPFAPTLQHENTPKPDIAMPHMYAQPPHTPQVPEPHVPQVDAPKLALPQNIP